MVTTGNVSGPSVAGAHEVIDLVESEDEAESKTIFTASATSGHGREPKRRKFKDNDAESADGRWAGSDQATEETSKRAALHDVHVISLEDSDDDYEEDDWKFGSSTDDAFLSIKPPPYAAALSTAKQAKPWMADDDPKKMSTMKESAQTDHENKVILADGTDDAKLTHNIMAFMESMNLIKSSMSLCTNKSSLVHVQQKDKWSCGFRNFQMLLGCLLPRLPADHAFFAKFPRRAGYAAVLPTVSQLQRWIRDSWSEGYDAKSARHFRYQTPTRIGAVEVASTLTYCGIDATVLQFMTCPASRQLLTTTILAYFAGSGCVCAGPNDSRSLANRILQHAERNETPLDSGSAPCGCLRSTLYLQWDGHSVTVIGIENLREPQGKAKPKPSDYALLVFDPAKNGTHLTNKMVELSSTKLFQIPCQSLIRKDIQLVLATTNPITLSQQRERRYSVSISTAAEGAVFKAEASRKR